MAEIPSTSTSYSTDPILYLYTSLTAGSSHIITATSRLETILKANKIAFRAIDVATDEKARMLWGRRSKGRRLPGLVRYGMIIGDLEQIEEWNEYRELKRQVANTLQPSDAASAADTTSPVATSLAPPTISGRRPSATPHIQITDTPSRTSSAASGASGTPYSATLRQASEEAAAKAKDNTRAKLGSAVGKKSSLSQTETEQAVAQTVIEQQKKEDENEDEKEKDEAADGAADEALKTAQRRASVVAMSKRPALEDTAFESTADFNADDVLEAEGGSPRSRPGFSATSPKDKEKVVKALEESTKDE